MTNVQSLCYTLYNLQIIWMNLSKCSNFVRTHTHQKHYMTFVYIINQTQITLMTVCNSLYLIIFYRTLHIYLSYMHMTGSSVIPLDVPFVDISCTKTTCKHASVSNIQINTNLQVSNLDV